jgi:hypothetical protein
MSSDIPRKRYTEAVSRQQELLGHVEKDAQNIIDFMQRHVELSRDAGKASSEHLAAFALEKDPEAVRNLITDFSAKKASFFASFQANEADGEHLFSVMKPTVENLQTIEELSRRCAETVHEATHDEMKVVGDAVAKAADEL